MSSEQPRLSIVIPVYNSEQYVPKTIESILEQSFSDYQVILVDDGSTDNSYAVISRYAENDNRFVALKKENGGQSSARNLGVKKATGKYILYVDSDDFLKPNVLETMVSQAEVNNLDILRGKIERLEDGTTIRHDVTEVPGKVVSGRERLLAGNISCSICAYMYRREFLTEHKIEFLEGVFHEDMDYIVRAYSYADKTLEWDEFFYVYVSNSLSTTHLLSMKRVEDYYRVAENVSEFAHNLEDEELYEGFFKEYLAFMFSHTVNMCAENRLSIGDFLKVKGRREKIVDSIGKSGSRKYRVQSMVLKLHLETLYGKMYRMRGRLG